MNLLTSNQNIIYDQIIKDFYFKYPDYKIIYLTITGSKLYGLETNDSDTDIKGIFIPSKKDLILQKMINIYSADTNKKKNESKDIDFTLFSIHHFLNKLKNSETNSVEMYFSMFRDDTILLETDESNKIKNNRESLFNLDLRPMLKFGESIIKKNKFYDSKPISHALRISYQAVQLYQTKNLKYPLPKEWIINILKVKFNQMNKEEIDTLILNNINSVEEYNIDESNLNKTDIFILSFY